MDGRLKILFSLVCLTAVAYCLLNAAGFHVLCESKGCEVYAGYRFLGLSFYMYGAAGFLGLFILGLIPGERAAWLFPLALAAGLLIDSGFLAWQTLFWPCTGCLMAAAFLGAATMTALPMLPRRRRRRLAPLATLWLALFLAVGAGIVHETLMKPWALYDPPNAEISVFFSPTCPTCRREVGRLLNSPLAERTAFYPVAKNEEDERRIETWLDKAPGSGSDFRTRLAAIFDTPAREFPDIGLELHLLANKAALARTGQTTVPLFLSSKMPLSPTLGLEGWSSQLLPPKREEGCSFYEETNCDPGSGAVK